MQDRNQAVDDKQKTLMFTVKEQHRRKDQRKNLGSHPKNERRSSCRFIIESNNVVAICDHIIYRTI